MLQTKKIILIGYLLLFCSSLSLAGNAPSQPDSTQKKLILNDLRFVHPSTQTIKLSWWQKLGLKILQNKIKQKSKKIKAIPTRKTDAWAIVSFISGILAWFVLGIVLGLAAVIFGQFRLLA
jgi:hypothetical protein